MNEDEIRKNLLVKFSKKYADSWGMTKGKTYEMYCQRIFKITEVNLNKRIVNYLLVKVADDDGDGKLSLLRSNYNLIQESFANFLEKYEIFDSGMGNHPLTNMFK